MKIIQVQLIASVKMSDSATYEDAVEKVAEAIAKKRQLDEHIDIQIDESDFNVDEEGQT